MGVWAKSFQAYIFACCCFFCWFAIDKHLVNPTKHRAEQTQQTYYTATKYQQDLSHQIMIENMLSMDISTFYIFACCSFSFFFFFVAVFACYLVVVILVHFFFTWLILVHNSFVCARARNAVVPRESHRMKMKFELVSGIKSKQNGGYILFVAKWKFRNSVCSKVKTFGDGNRSSGSNWSFFVFFF